MRLFTYQTPEFDIVRSKTDKTKSFYYSKWPEFKEPYDWLYNLLGTDQWIWCYNDINKHCSSIGEEVVRWELEVPDNLVKIIDSHVWHCVLNDINVYPDYVYETDSSNIDALEEVFNINNPKEKVWKDSILTKETSGYVEILVPSPILPEWVIDNRHYCEYNQEVFNEELVIRNFSNENEFLRYYNILKNGLNKRNKKIIYENITQENETINLTLEWKHECNIS